MIEKVRILYKRSSKTVISNIISLKEPVEKFLRSGLVYQIKCSLCEVCYVLAKRVDITASPIQRASPGRTSQGTSRDVYR